MEKIDIDEKEEYMPELSPCSFKVLTEALNLENCSINFLQAEPGESLSYTKHTHTKQEEIFYIVSGSIVFETKDQKVKVGKNQIIHFNPDDYQIGRNKGEKTAEALAIGAPKNPGEDIRLYMCETCDEETKHGLKFEKEEKVELQCQKCNTVNKVYKA